jgi:hypothetical protein
LLTALDEPARRTSAHTLAAQLQAELASLNAAKFVETTYATQRHCGVRMGANGWVPDESSDSCTTCKARFGFVRHAALRRLPRVGQRALVQRARAGVSHVLRGTCRIARDRRRCCADSPMKESSFFLPPNIFFATICLQLLLMMDGQQ